MKLLNSKWALLMISAAIVALIGCKKENEEEPLPEPIITSGMVVACEGSFNQNNASLHWIGDDGAERNNLFFEANGVNPGDVLQSYREFNGIGYLVLNNSQKVEVVNAENFQSLGAITGCDYPRDVFVLSQQKGYLTNGSLAGQVLIFNPTTRNIIGSINVGNGPEQIAYNGQFVFVANSGGWASDNTVSVINPLNDQVVATVAVGDRPVSVLNDYQNNVWVLCAGAIEYDENWNVIGETAARLIRIDGSAHVVTADVNIGAIGDHPTNMALTSDFRALYIVNNGLLTFDINTAVLSDGPVTGGAFSAVGVDGENGNIYLASVPDYVNDDEIFVYSNNGELLKTIGTGIAPRSMVYRAE